MKTTSTYVKGETKYQKQGDQIYRVLKVVDVERTDGQDRHITFLSENVKKRQFWRSGLDGEIILNCVMKKESTGLRM
jgi:hypothetical protein